MYIQYSGKLSAEIRETLVLKTEVFSSSCTFGGKSDVCCLITLAAKDVENQFMHLIHSTTITSALQISNWAVRLIVFSCLTRFQCWESCLFEAIMMLQSASASLLLTSTILLYHCLHD